MCQSLVHGVVVRGLWRFVRHIVKEFVLFKVVGVFSRDYWTILAKGILSMRVDDIYARSFIEGR